MDLKNLSLTELLLVRNWIQDMRRINIREAGKVEDLAVDVDKELWVRLISSKTPWDSRKRFSRVKNGDKR